jgi:hypothetical protein
MHARTISLALAGLAGAAILAVPASALTFQVNVKLSDSSCKLALNSAKAPNTAINFHPVNSGTVAHGLMIWGVKSHMFKPAGEGDLLVNFHKAGTFHYACTTGSYYHPKLYGKGVFTIRS